MACEWTHVKGREIASHTLDLIRHTDGDGYTCHTLCVDCMTVRNGTLANCESAWRAWVRALNAIARRRAS